eukprot:CAMPEP_0113954606 /NCGR_PEP_ID=MMETSP0011_2-20120614/682_1 /TAXON_ID=101924 /ORGANISM="Rhodosorus marinus" /LENGTH=42 /DNA_ID=CAMNT_0000963825 /DNA_START=355 /DNA_END=483 /DNA_ORIENTATION=+ /assembly_acc=CAM_ASM_000156
MGNELNQLVEASTALQMSIATKMVHDSKSFISQNTMTLYSEK